MLSPDFIVPWTSLDGRFSCWLLPSHSSMVLTWRCVFPTAHHSVQRSTSAPNFWRIAKLSKHGWWTNSSSFQMCEASEVVWARIVCSRAAWLWEGVFKFEWRMACGDPNLETLISPDFKSACPLRNPGKFMGQIKTQPIRKKYSRGYHQAPIVPSWGLLAGPILGFLYCS